MLCSYLEREELPRELLPLLRDELLEELLRVEPPDELRE